MRKAFLIIFVVSTSAVIIFAFWLFSRTPSPEQISQAFPDDSYQIFTQGKKTILYSLKPEESIEGQEDFHGYTVLGKTEIKDEQMQTLLKRSLLNSMTFTNGAACNNPQHGLQIMADNKILDFVICFESGNFVSYYGDRRGVAKMTGKKAESFYNQVLRDAKIEISR